MRMFFFVMGFLLQATVAYAEAGRIPSVPFNEGWVGTEGSNPQQNQGVVDLLSAENIVALQFSQPSSQAAGVFVAQGNDVPGVLTLGAANGTTYQFDGAVVWVDKDGGITQSIGFLVAGTEEQALATLTVSGSTPSYNNFSLELIGNLANYPEGTETGWGSGSNDIAGSADTKGIVDILNAYLAQTETRRPSGPVTSDALTVDVASQIRLTGDASLAGGEQLTVEVNGTTYTSGDDFLAADGSNWTLTLPAGSLPTGLYDVTATITNADGYTLSDTSSNELLVTEVGAAPNITVTGNGVAIADGDTSPDASDDTDFGTADVSSGAVTKTYTICNDGGTAPLLLTDIALSGADASSFAVANLTNDTLNPGDCATFDIRFDPASVGAKSATVTITSNGGDGAYSFGVAGYGSSSGGSGSISGIATRDGAGEAGVTVKLFVMVNGSYEYVASVQTESDGSYEFTSLDEGTYAVAFEKTGAVVGADSSTTRTPDGTLLKDSVENSGAVIRSIVISAETPSVLSVDAVLVDPSGVVYDAVTRQPISGATVTLQMLLADGSTIDVPSVQVNGGTNPQTTGPDGAYAFQFSDPAPSGTYTIKVEAAGYRTINGAARTFSRLIPASTNASGLAGLFYVSQGRVSVGTGPEVIDIVPFPTAPADGQTLRYYLLFDMTFSDWTDANSLSHGIINNHLPMEKLSAGPESADVFLPLIREDLKAILDDDRQQSLTRQSRRIGSPLTKSRKHDSLPVRFERGTCRWRWGVRQSVKVI